MKIEFDQIKSDKNLAVRGLPFDRASDFGWSFSEITVDIRNDYLKPGMLLSDILTTVFIFFVLPRLLMLSE